MVLPCGAIGLPSGGSCEKFQRDHSHNGGGDRNFIFFSPFCEEPVIKQRIPGTRCPAVRPPTGIGLVCLQPGRNLNPSQVFSQSGNGIFKIFAGLEPLACT